MTAISKHRNEVVSLTCDVDVADAEARLRQILTVLKEKRVNVLPGGTLERYLPAYSGDDYDITDDAKRQAVDAEMDRNGKANDGFRIIIPLRGSLAVCNLPSKPDVDLEADLSSTPDYIHFLQSAATDNPEWTIDQITPRLRSIQPATASLFSVQELTRGENSQFRATIRIPRLFGRKPRLVRVTQDTNAGTRNFEIEDDVDNSN